MRLPEETINKSRARVNTSATECLDYAIRGYETTWERLLAVRRNPGMSRIDARNHMRAAQPAIISKPLIPAQPMKSIRLVQSAQSDFSPDRSKPNAETALRPAGEAGRKPAKHRSDGFAA